MVTWRARLAYASNPSAATEGRLADISRGGLCFVSNTLFQENAKVSLVTQAPAQSKDHPAPVIEIHGTVAYSFHSDMHFKTGIHITRFAQGEAAYYEECCPA